MNLLVVVLLTVLWASILVPGAVRGRHDRSPSASVDAFERSMSILASETRGRFGPSPPGRHIMVVADPPALVHGRAHRGRALARRRAILQGLAVAVATTGLLAVVSGGVATVLFGAAASALVAYVGVLTHLKARAEQTRRTVRRLPAAHRPEPGTAPDVLEA
jgi:hypothetical protein